MTDFLCVKTDCEPMVRECVQRKHLLKPMTLKSLDTSRVYRKRPGVEEWGWLWMLQEKAKQLIRVLETKDEQ